MKIIGLQRALAHIFSLCCIAGLSGSCSTSDTTLSRDAASDEGMINPLAGYNLPKANMIAAISYGRDAKGDGLLIVVSTPRTMPGEHIPVSSVFSSLSEDKFVVETDPSTGYLKHIGINLTDKTSETLQAAAGSIGTILGTFAQGTLAGLLPQMPPAALTAAEEKEKPKCVEPSFVKTIASVSFDPTDKEAAGKVNAKFWLNLQNFVDQIRDERAHCPATKLTLVPTVEKRVKEAKVALQTDIAKPSKDPSDGDVSTWLGDHHPFISVIAPEVSDTPSSCLPDKLAKEKGEGVCVRMPGTVQIGLSSPNGPEVWQPVIMPINSEVYLLDVKRLPCVAKSFSVDFTDGFPGKREVSQSSQALCWAGMPQAIVESFIGSAGKAVAAVTTIHIDNKKSQPPVTTTSASTTTSSVPGGKPTTVSQTTQTTTGDASPGKLNAQVLSADATHGNSTAPDTAGNGDQHSVVEPKLWFSTCSYALACPGVLSGKLEESANTPEHNEQSPEANGNAQGHTSNPPEQIKPPVPQNPKKEKKGT